MAKDLGVKTVYLEDLIDTEDFSQIDAKHQKGRLNDVLEVKKKYVVLCCVHYQGHDFFCLCTIMI